MRHAIPTATQVGTESVRGCFCSTAHRYSQWELGDEGPAWGPASRTGRRGTGSETHGAALTASARPPGPELPAIRR